MANQSGGMGGPGSGLKGGTLVYKVTRSGRSMLESIRAQFEACFGGDDSFGHTDPDKYWCYR